MLQNLPKNVVIVSKSKPEKNNNEPKKELAPFSNLAGAKVKENRPADLDQAQEFTIEKKDASNGNERLIIGDQKFLYILPDQLRIIVDRMLESVAEKVLPH